MFRNMSIKTQIISSAFFLVLLSVVCASGTALWYAYIYMKNTFSDEATRSIVGFEQIIAGTMKETEAFRDNLIHLEELGRLVSERDKEGVYALTKPILNASGVDVLVIAAADGEVLARPHDKARVGDNIGKGDDFKTAIAGTSYAMFMSNPSSKLGYYCGGPVKYQGKTVGMVRAAVSLENQKIVDEIKSLYGVEATVFAGRTRINTTIEENGKRVVGTDASPAVVDAVVNKGGTFSGSVQLFGQEYLSRYTPIKDSTSGVKGMFFTGKPISELDRAVTSIVRGVSLVSIGALAAAFLLTLLIARGIARPISRIVSILRRVGAGNFLIPGEEFSYPGRDEMGVIFAELKQAVETQADCLRDTKGSADTVTSDAEELSALAAATGESARKIDASVSAVVAISRETQTLSAETNDRLKQVSADAAQVSTSAEESTKSLRDVSVHAQAAAESFNRVLSEMEQVMATVSGSNEHINSLEQSIGEITNFVSVITGIAAQTNLLALNAAIEATRAGESGRGFSVVADEVRKLAEESSGAAKRVNQVIEPIREKTQQVIEDAAKSVTILEKTIGDAAGAKNDLMTSSRSIEAANESTKHIFGLVEEQTSILADVAGRADALVRQMEQLTSQIESIKSEATETLEASHQVSHTADSLGEMASSLNESLSRFSM
ncbi:MAG: methyl-accepting chemotaxis protein [Synergistaceae bacterium]|jgi:methyl-accepting chemotaxis protein|nr:methyl-accepting chemotaxis protein [Synergistaceae bacterium]